MITSSLLIVKCNTVILQGNVIILKAKFLVVERLAEYGWKPHRKGLAQVKLSRASINW